MKKLTITKGSTWINLRPADLPTQPKRIYLFLKGDKGLMDLTFTEVQAHKFGEQISNLLEEGMTIHQTAASAAIRLEVPLFKISDGLDVGLPKVDSAFASGERLIRFYRTHKAALDAAARAAHTPTSRRR